MSFRFYFENDEPRIDSYRGKRIRQLADGSSWSDLNPLAQRLAREHVLASDDGDRAWRELAAVPPSQAPPLRYLLCTCACIPLKAP